MNNILFLIAITLYSSNMFCSDDSSSKSHVIERATTPLAPSASKSETPAQEKLRLIVLEKDLYARIEQKRLEKYQQEKKRRPTHLVADELDVPELKLD